MQLLVFRHGIAEDAGPDGTDDSRRLTEEGIKKTKKIVKRLAEFAPEPEVILTSPRVRAKQTADIAADRFGLNPVIDSTLADYSHESIIETLDQREEQVVMIVGHEPVLSALIEQLCTGGEGTHFVQLKKAGCALLDYFPGSVGYAALNWLVTPKLLLGD